MVSQVLGSSFTNAAQLPNYVNGRLLAAEDLATGQSTLVQRDDLVGQAAGAGIVNGLWVTASAASLTISSGLGITPSGEPVSVPAAVTLQLSMAGAQPLSSGGSFSNCATTAAGAQTAVTTGAYLLTVLPASQLQGQAPMAVSPASDTPVSCTAQWSVEGVQFKAISLPLPSTVDGVAVTSGNQRNLLAHWCYGTEQLAQLGVDPFNFATGYRGLDQLSPTDLTPADLPLGVFYWDGGSITFADNWSARRRTVRPDVANSSWFAVTADQRVADGEARFQQFQDQILDIVTAGTSRSTVAANLFGLLPPVGLLPVALDETAADINALYQSNVTSNVTPSTSQERPLAAATFPASPAIERFTFQPIDILTPQVISQLQNSLSALPQQSGFVPATFFGSVATFGGFITWDTAYFALRQSYLLEPVTIPSPPAATATPPTLNLPTLNLTTLESNRPLTEAEILPSSGSVVVSPSISPATNISTTSVLRNTNIANIGSIAQTGIVAQPFPIVFKPPVLQPIANPISLPPPPALITYYYVIENFIEVLNAINGAGGAVTPYLVFIKNQFWPLNTKAPFVSSMTSAG